MHFNHVLAILVATLVVNTLALKVQLFDSTGFRGPYLTSSNTEGCTNLTTENFLQEGRSLKTDMCVMIFKDVDCKSFSFRLDRGEYPNLADVKHEGVNFVNPKSYRICTSGEGGIPVNVDVHGNAMTLGGEYEPFNGLLMTYRDVCTCMNLPTRNPFIGNVTHIHNFGNCIKIYTQVNCTGENVELLGGVSPQSLDLSTIGSFIIPSASIGLCSHRPTCYTLNSTAFKFELSAEPQKVREISTSSNMAITAKTRFINNGTATQTQTYEARRTITETIEVSRVTGYNSMSHNTTRTPTYFWNWDWWFGWTATLVSDTLTEAYQYSEEQTGDKYVSKEEREVIARQQIEIPPCTMYEVDSYITMIENYPINYTVFMYVTGMSEAGPLTADEVRERLDDGLTYIEDFDNYTVIASGDGGINAAFSLEAVIDGSGGPIDGCQVTNTTT